MAFRTYTLRSGTVITLVKVEPVRKGKECDAWRVCYLTSENRKCQWTPLRFSKTNEPYFLVGKMVMYLREFEVAA